MHAQYPLRGSGHNHEWNALSHSGQNYGRDCLGLVLLQLGSFFDDCISITISAASVNKPSVQRFLSVTLSSIGPNLIKAALK